MAKARKESAFHLILLSLVQFISLSVIILNATALYLLRGSPLDGLVKTYGSPADYALLILGSVSFLTSSIYLCLHLHLYFRIRDENLFSPPKTLSATEMIISVVSIALWTVSTSVILTHSQESDSPCRFTASLYTQNHGDMCELFDTTLMLAFAAVGSWVLVLLATLMTLIRSPIPPTTIFTIEAPPQRFSQPVLVSSPNEAHFQFDRQNNRPYCLGYQNQNNPNRLSPPSPRRHVLNKPLRISNGDPQSSSSRYMVEHILLDGDHHSESSSVIAYTNTKYYSYYQPQYNVSSHNNSSTSYYSTLPQTQTSIQSLSTIESIYTGFQPLSIELPVIQVGALSHIDASFLQKRQ